MTAVDHAELTRLAEGAGGDAWGLNDWRPEGQILVCGGEGHSYGLFATVDDALPDVAAFIAAANPAVVLALLSEIEGLKAERDAYRDAAHLEAVDCDAAEAALRTQAPDSWRPIDDDAKDGRPILAGSVHHDSREVVCWQDGLESGSLEAIESGQPEQGWVNDGPIKDRFYANPNYFTHWQPIALRPQTAESGK